MSEDVVGSVSVRIVPNAQNFGRDADAALSPQADALGKKLADSIAQKITDGIAQSAREGIQRANVAGAAQAKGQEAGGAFGTSMRSALTAALKDLPKVKIDADFSQADIVLNELRARMEELSGKTIGVDISAGDAKAQLDQIRADLERLAADSPDVGVKVNAETARAELDRFSAKVDELAAKSPSIKVDADTAEADAQLAATKAAAADSAGSGGLGALMTAAIALSPALVAVGAVGVGALAGIAGAATAAGAAMGVALIALKPVMEAYQAVQGAQNQNNGPALASAAAAISTANRQVSQSELALQNTRDNVAAAAAAADQKVRDSKQSLADTERSVNEQISNAAQALTVARQNAAQQDISAEQAVATAKQTAAQQIASAEQSVGTAEQGLANAQQSALLAQQTLNDARQQAVHYLQQMGFSATDAALSQRQAVLSLDQAQQNLHATLSNPKSTQLQREQAQLQLDMAKQAVIERTQAAKDAHAANAKAQKAGIEGDPQVVAAKRALAQANQAVKTQQQGLLNAEAAVTRARLQGAQQVAAAEQRLQQARVQGARAIAAAEQHLSDAKYNGSRQIQKAQEAVSQARAADAQQARQGAFQIEQAQNSVKSSLQALANAHRQYGQVGAQSAGKVAQAMSKLSPAGVDFLNFLLRAKNGFDGLSKKAQQGFLPGLERGLKDLAPLGKPLEGLVSGLATTMGGIAEKAGKALGSPDGVAFVNFLSKNLPTWLQDASDMAGGFIKGLGSLFMGFGPTITLFLGWFSDMGKAFGDWATHVTKTKGFQDLLAYIAKEGPVVGGIFKDIFTIIGKLAVGLAPFGSFMLGAIKSVLDFTAKLSPKVLGAIALAIGAIVLGMKAWALGTKIVEGATKAWTLAQAAFNIVMDANPIALVILALVALGVAVVVMYKKVGWFRDGVKAVWKAIKTAWNDTIDWIVKTAWPWLKGVFDDIESAFSHVGGWFRDRWNDITGYFTDANDAVARLLGPKGLQGVFSGAISAISGIWHMLASIVAVPINAVIRLIDDPFIKGLNWILDKAGTGLKIPLIPQINTGGSSSHSAPNRGGGHQARYNTNFSSGGYTGDGHKLEPAGIVHKGEVVWSQKDVALAGGPAAANALRPTMRGYDVGGIVGGIGGAIGDLLGAVGGSPTASAHLGIDATNALAKAKEFVVNLAKGAFHSVANSMPGKIILGLGSRIADGIYNMIMGSGGSPSNHAVPGGGGRIAGGAYMGGGSFDTWWKQAIAVAGSYWSQFYDATRTVAQNESGFNPNAINLWDSNAKAGHPSQGLMQFIPSTFAAYMWPGHAKFLSPVDQILAFFRYSSAAYGGPNGVPGVRGVRSGSGYVGYGSGTDSATAGWHVVGEYGPELVNFRGGEQVYNREQTLQLANASRHHGPIDLSDGSIRRLAAQMSQMSVRMDGRQVGQVTAPHVAAALAGSTSWVG